MKTKVIKWKDLKIGDQFLDGSIVLDIEDWKMQRCFELKLKGNEPLVVSEDHMMMLKVFDKNNNIINGSFEHSKIQREIIAADSDIWISALDAYNSFQLGCKIANEWDEEIEYVKEFDNGEEKRVRCITTDVGHYVINGICNHNTARKLFYCMSDIMVVDDCGGPHIDALHCKMPEGHVCRKCANMTKGGETIKPGDLVGGLVSTNMSEALTQLSMKNMHPLFGKQVVEIYRNESEFKIVTDGPVKNGKDSLGRSYCSVCPICGREFHCAASHKEAWCGNCHVEYKCPICEETCSSTSIRVLKQLENNEIFYHNHECYIKSKQFNEQNRIMASHWIEPCDKCGDNFASHSILSGCNTCNNRTSASIEQAARLGKKWYKINLEQHCYNIKFCNICKKDTLHHGDKCTKCYPENSTRDPQYEQFCPICGENTIWYAGKCTICYPEFKQTACNNLGNWIKPISYNHCIVCGIETPHKYNDNNELYCQVCAGERVWCERCQKWETINYNSQKHWLFYKSKTRQWINNNQSLLEKVQNIIEGDYSILLNSPAISGVYGWFLNGTCLYIGKSVDIYSRSLDHIMNMWLYPEEWYMITPYIDTFPTNNKLELLILETSNDIADSDLWHSELQWINKLNPDSQKCDGTDHIRSLRDRTKIIK